MKMHLNMLSVKWRPFCPGEDELKQKISKDFKYELFNPLSNGSKSPYIESQTLPSYLSDKASWLHGILCVGAASLWLLAL